MEPIKTFADGMVDHFQRQEDMAFKLKLQNALIEQQKLSAMEQFDYQKASPEVGDAVLGMGGIPADGKRRSVAELGLIQKGTVGIANANARAGGRGGARYDRNALIESILKNPVAYNDLTATTKADIFPDLQKRGFKRLDKVLPGELQVKADAATNGLEALERVNAKIKEASNDFAQMYAPGTVGAKNLRGDLGEIVDVIKRIRSGAATSGREDDAYEAQIMADGVSDLLDNLIDGNVDANTIDYRLNTIYKPYLTRMTTMQERRRTEEVVDPKSAAKNQGAPTLADIRAEKERRRKLREANKAPKQ